MNILGFHISFGRKKESPEADLADAQATPAKVNSTVRSKQLVYNTSGRSTDFQEPDYNLTDVAAAIDTESYFRTAVDKFVNEIWKHGWGFVGKNDDAVAYVKRRFHQIAMVTEQPTDDLFEDIARQMVMYSNVFLEKKRSDTASGGHRWTRFDGKQLIPIAGLFVLDSTSMEIARKDNGKPLRYKQVLPNPSREYPEWPADNMMHMHYSRQRGLAFGTPFVIPTLDDIRALRSMEQNVEILVFQHAVPLYLYKVGTELAPVQDGEIEDLQNRLEEMPKHGVLIVSERHTVEAIGAQGEAINAEPYLNYFKNRVLSGLRVGSVVMGEGDTANRSTAATINAIVQDVAQAFQKRLKIFIDLLITEILAEGGFEWDVGQFDKLVELFIPEIDLEKKIAQENHYIQLWENNAITAAEYRRLTGRDPFTDEEWDDTFWMRIGQPKALIQALDEKFVQQGSNKGTTATSTSSTTKKTTANKNRPANQHGSRSAPKTNKDEADTDIEDTIGEGVTDEHAALLVRLGYPDYNATLRVIYSDMKRDLASRLDEKDKKEMLEGTTEAGRSAMLDATRAYVRRAFNTGALKGGYSSGEELGVQMLLDEAIKDVKRLTNDVQKEAEKAFENGRDSLSLISKMEAMVYRTDFIARTQLMKAYNQGIAKAAIFFDDTRIGVSKNSQEKDGCKEEERIVDLSDPEAINSLPPFHPNCTCTLQRKAPA
jgi:hypothetical protein